MVIRMNVATNVMPANPQEGMLDRNDLFLFSFIWFELEKPKCKQNIG